MSWNNVKIDLDEHSFPAQMQAVDNRMELSDSSNVDQKKAKLTDIQRERLNSNQNQQGC